MDFLNKFVQQLTELFRSMTPAARITSGILLTAIVVSMFYLFQFQMSGGEDYLYGNTEFSSEEVGQMLTAFGNAGLNDHTVVGNRIRVPLSQRDLYYKALTDNSAVPYSIKNDSGLNALTNPFMSSAAMKQQQTEQRDKTLERNIAGLRNIASAKVQAGESHENPPFNKIRKTCYVGIKPIGNYTMSGEDFRAVSNMVKGALSGIKDEDIYIVDYNSGEAWTGSQVIAAEGDSELIRVKRRWESEYKKNIRDVLIDYHGATIAVNVSVDPVASTSTWSKKVEPGTTIRQTSEKENTKSTSGGNGGAPGVRSNNNNGAAANGTASIATNRNNSTDIQKETSENVAGGVLTNEVRAGYDVLQVEASIGIPQEWVEKYYRQMNPPAEDAEQAAISYTDLQEFFESYVKNVVAERVRPLIKASSKAADDPYESVVVVMNPSIPLEAVPGPDYVASAVTWLSANWQNLGLMGFGLFAIVMLRSMVGTASKDLSAADTVQREFGSLLPEEDTGDEIEEVIIDEDGNKRIVKRRRVEENQEEEEEKKNRLLEKFNSREPTLRDELIELVEADLDAAAEVLRSWIGEPV